MDDIELAYGVTSRIGDLYKEGKLFSLATPGYALTQLRGLASVYCDLLFPDFDERTELATKIRMLDERRLLTSKEKRQLKVLQLNGNKGAHPEKYDFQAVGFAEQALESLYAARSLIEANYRSRGQEVPDYEVVDVTEDPLKDVCYRAMIDGDVDAIHQVGVYFKERADLLKRQDQFILQDGYGPASRSDIDKAMYWFKQGADARHPDCMYQYGSYKAKDTGMDESTRLKGEQLALHASELDHPDALVFIGDCNLHGSPGVAKDEAAALLYFEKAARHGHPEALSQLGAMYAVGRGCEINLTKAASYCQEAAELGYPQAQFNLFVLYSTGQGVPTDKQLALKWLIEAAAQGFPNATFSLGYEIWEGTLPDRNLAEAVDCFERSISFIEFRVRAARAYAQLTLRLEDNKAGWEKAASALQLCMETIATDGDPHDDEAACLELSRIAVGKLRKWLSQNWTAAVFDLNSLLVCGLFDRNAVPVRSKFKRLAELKLLIDALSQGDTTQRQRNMFRLLREVGVEGTDAIERLQHDSPIPARTGRGSREQGRNDPCWCGSGQKYKRCHGT
ncbi:hypothetical protein FAS41_29150 [Pseudomonas nicosulfuronedens]|uniref:DUF4145 domain-containing protein n=1 Tax=Pseudomonas nicosulfuronedens TaxID=2571105 RepID=A0A5R9R8G0_9PSED|nr:MULTISPECIES: SEC-C metal-binding domain-containing protein [Pseudomonas]TLX70074.1 hypothetical protein FAS41_29150 [Pseudomonas nicosulfuronedens]